MKLARLWTLVVVRPRSKRPALRALSCLCLGILMFIGVSSYGQTSGLGLPPYNSFASGGIDNINLSNLNVNIQLPLYGRKGRGIDLQLNAFYNSVRHAMPNTLQAAPFWQSGVAHTYEVNWSSVDQINCGFEWPDDMKEYTRWFGVTVKEVDGTTHSYPNVEWTNQNYWCNGQDATYYGGGMPDADPSGPMLEIDTDPWGGPNIVLVYERDGTIFDQINHTITDRNGNVIPLQPQPGQPINYVDTQGQTALSVQGVPLGGTAVWTYPLATGTASFTTQFSVHPLTINFKCSGADSSTGAYLLDSVTLASGQFYTFQYDQMGRITYMKLPTGGTVTYAYPGPVTCNVFRQEVEDTALDRTVDGVTTSYRRTGTSTQVTFPNGSVSTHNFGYYDGIELDTSGNGTITHTCWATDGTSFCNASTPGFYGGLPPVFTKAIQVINTEDGSTFNKLETSIYGSPTETREYDYGNTNINAPDRRRVITYDSNYYYFPHPVPAEEQMYDHGVLVSDTRYFHDQGSTIVTQPAPPQHSSNIYPYGGAGNLTQIDRWVGGNTWISEHRTYFDTGNIASVQDGNGNITTYTYGGCGSSFLTQTNHPANLVDSTSWECNSVQPASVTDVSGVVTNFTYADPFFGRMTQRSRPVDGALREQAGRTPLSFQMIWDVRAVGSI